jgi:hypothetical protein
MPRNELGEVDQLLGVLHDEVGAVLPGHEAAQVAEEVGRGDREALQDHRDVQALEQAQLLGALHHDDLARHVF